MVEAVPATPLRVSVVIPAFKRSEMLRKAVLSALQQDLDKNQYEVIVVDSSPDDQNVRVVKELEGSASCSLRCYVKEAEGPAASRNLGVRHARGEAIAFLDSDCRATPGWLREGLAAFEDGVGLVQGRTVGDPEGKDGVFTSYVLVEKEGFVYETCNIFYPRKVLEEMGGFDNSYYNSYYSRGRALTPMGGEDVDLAWRVKRRGWKSRFAARALVYHEIRPIPVIRWYWNKRYFTWPLLAKRFPELRKFFFARYFWDKSQACLVAAVTGLLLAPVALPALALCIPYAALRLSVPSKSFPGVLRPLRILAYFPRDLAAFLLLLAGSLWHRTVLL